MSTAALDESGFVPFINMIAANAVRHASGVAFREGDHALTWKTLHERVAQVARALQASGVKPGDKVAVLGFSIAGVCGMPVRHRLGACLRGAASGVGQRRHACRDAGRLRCETSISRSRSG